MQLVHEGKTYNIEGSDEDVQSRAAELFGDLAGAIYLDAIKRRALRAVDTQHASLLRKLTGGATIEERDTWQSKELAARALMEYEDATPSQVEMLTIEAGYLSISAETLAGTIIGKADLFKKLTGLAAGVRGKARAAIAAASTPDELQVAVDMARSDVQHALATFNGG